MMLTVRSIFKLLKKKNLRMPIWSSIYKITSDLYSVWKFSPTEPTIKLLECSEKTKQNIGNHFHLTFIQFSKCFADSCLVLGTAPLLC